MIERYNCPEISDQWTQTAKFKTYLEVELALLKALEKETIPEGVHEQYKKSAKIDINRINEIEQTTQHDVIAFCSSITELVPKEYRKYFHFGCTSSDIIDTATTLQIKRSLELILKKYKILLKSLKAKAIETENLMTLGRSHGIYAEPMSFGQKFLSAYSEFYRHFQSLTSYYENELTGQLSGAVGNYTVLTPEIENTTISSLGLATEPISTQIIPRDRMTKLISINSMIASAIERFATELRLLQHSDVSETYEGFSAGQKGSSTMPHKKNPISSENLCGIARVIRSHLLLAHENSILWHERDISHSSAERIYLPDNLGLVFYALRRLTSTVDNLVIDKDKIQNKVLNNFTYLSSYVLHELLKNTDQSRDEVYSKVQKASFEAKNIEEFIGLIQKINKNINFENLNQLDENTLKSIYLKHTHTVFQRVFDQCPLLVE